MISRAKTGILPGTTGILPGTRSKRGQKRYSAPARSPRDSTLRTQAACRDASAAQGRRFIDLAGHANYVGATFKKSGTCKAANGCLLSKSEEASDAAKRTERSLDPDRSGHPRRQAVPQLLAA